MTSSSRSNVVPNQRPRRIEHFFGLGGSARDKKSHNILYNKDWLRVVAASGKAIGFRLQLFHDQKLLKLPNEAKENYPLSKVYLFLAWIRGTCNA